MSKKKFLSLGLALLVSASLLAGCGSDDTEEEETSTGTEQEQEETKDGEEDSSGDTSYEDGVYFAQEDSFSEESGWKYVATIKVEDGKIVEAEWNGAHKDGGTDKVTRSESGEYGMVENGGAQAPWAEQAEKAEAYLIEKQDPTAIEYSNDEGATDAISGVSIKVKSFFDLAEKALSSDPVGEGQYKDGNYTAEEEDFSEESGWKYTTDITVINGYIVAADWDGLSKEEPKDDDGNIKTKDQVSADGEYGMVEKGGAQAPWVEQADKVEAYLIEKQDPTAIEYSNDEGATDAISGVSIKVKSFFELAEKALESAK
ncbi:FMN-binding protein [Senegalia massiliensis]|uniref:FMN-binding protein n=1 Tax=Senegalia massiliensis TaxID=1720316 RepID=UPI0010318F80|nr:FMN-binding protein [Senegalia massiliensis]